MEEEKKKANYGKGCLILIIALIGWGFLMKSFIEIDPESDSLTNASWLSCIVLSIIYWVAVYYFFIRDKFY